MGINARDLIKTVLGIPSAAGICYSCPTAGHATATGFQSFLGVANITADSCCKSEDMMKFSILMINLSVVENVMDVCCLLNMG